MWSDPNLNIDWPKGRLILSKKDKNNISFEEYLNNYG